MIVMLKLLREKILARAKKVEQAKTNISLFSPVKGKVMLRGEPLDGVAITRKYVYSWNNNEDKGETTYSDADGNFSFDEARERMILGKFLPHEAVIPQTIEAKYRGVTYTLWQMCKRDYDTMGELSDLENLDQVDSPLLEAYRQGYILLNCDLENSEDTYQRVGDHALISSISDLGFPYEQGLKDAAEILKNREDEFSAEVSNYFREHEDYFECLETESLTEFEVEKFEPYRHSRVLGVNSISYSDHLGLHCFDENYLTNTTEMEVSGEVILDLIDAEDKPLQARLWLHTGLFKVTPKGITLTPYDYTFMHNPSNINPEDEA